MKYIDFDLEVSRSNEEEYEISVHSQAGEAHTTMRFPFDKANLRERLKDIRHAILSSSIIRRGQVSPEELTVQEFGQALFQSFMSGEVLSRYDVSQEQARMQGIGLRLKLRILAPELAGLPWEFLYDPRAHNYLCLSVNTPLIRHPDVPHPIQPLKVKLPLQILGVVASPDDLARLNIEREKDLMEKILKDLQARGLVKLTWLSNPTWRELLRVIRHGPWHIFHFIGHGGFETRTQEGAIILTDDDHQSYWLTATNMGVLLRDQRTIQLALLNACEGAHGSENDLFSSTAATLVQQGIPAVLAMQDEITDEAAIEFTRTFYETLAEGMSIDAAVAEARRAIRFSKPGTLEWGTPVLYMRSPDGVLFELDKESVSPPLPPPVDVVPKPELVSREDEREPSKKPEHEPITGEAKPKAAEKPEPALKDFFISYTRADRSWAEWIAWQLEEAGYSTVLQAWDFRPGSNFVLEMQKAAQESKRTIVVLSPNYLQSKFTQPEWAAAFSQDSEGKQGTLLPVCVQACDLTGLLRTVIYIDLVGLDEQRTRETLLAGISHARSKPLTQPAFPAAVRRSVSVRPAFPGRTPLPPSPPPPSPPPARDFRRELASLIQRQVVILESLEMPTWTTKLQQLEQRFLTETFKVLVIGKFSSGKSTFLNALLGKKMLPIRSIPTTAIVTEIKWGEAPKALLHFPSTSGSSIREPQEISLDQLEHYLVIKDNRRSSANVPVMYEPPYAKVELFWPLDLSRTGMEILDTPGVSDDPEREKITMNYVSSVNLVLYVIACDAQLSMSEMQIIEMIRKAGHEHIFFVCNRINVIDEEEQDLVKGRCISQLAPLTNKGAKHVFFLDARGALDARVKGDTEQLERSGLRAIEEELKAFFAAERGRGKIRQPVAELKAALQEARNKLAGMRESVRPRADQEAEIRVWRARSQSELDQLELERQQLVSWLNEFRDETRKQVTGAANEFYGNVASKLEGLAQGYEIKRPVSITRVFFQEQQERVVKEVSSYLADEVSRMCKAWQRATLEPLLHSRMGGLAQELNVRARQLAQKLRQTDREDDSSISIAIFTEAFTEISVDDTTRVALIGWKPSVLIPDLLFGWSGGAALNTNAINRKIKDAVGKEYALKFQNLRTTLADTIGKNVERVLNRQLREVQSELTFHLDLAISSAHDRVNLIIEEETQERSKVEKTTTNLTAVANELNVIESEIDNLIKQVDPAK